MECKNKNVVVDYVTPQQACTMIGISASSTPQITRWIGEGRIPNVTKFGNNTAIPISWVKSECLERNVQFEGIKLEGGQVAVSLKDYEPISMIYKDNKKELDRIYRRMKRGTFDGDYVRFGNSYGIRK